MAGESPGPALIKLRHLPEPRDEHAIADMAEILAMVDADGELTVADLARVLGSRVEIEGGALEDQGEEDDGAYDQGEAEEDALEEADTGDEVPDPIEGGASPGTPVLSRSDRYYQLALDVFRGLRWRSEAFGEEYPFVLSDDDDVLSRNDHHTPGLYVHLLLAANLLRVAMRYRAALTNGFEVLSAEALRRYLPGNATVHVFSNNPLVNERRYTGELFDKLETLAKDLHENLGVSRAAFRPGDVGDNGMDVVGWVSFGDAAPGAVVAYGQCGCTKDWVEKQDSVHPHRWTKVLNLAADQSPFCFIPHCYREASGIWPLEGRQIHKSVLVDRLRMVSLLGDVSLTALGVPDTPVNEAWSFRELTLSA